ncbi:MAG: ribulose-phosphate 3-epimerase [Candidatus Eisenbacteria bacterium]
MSVAEVLPSLLSADFSRLEEEIRSVERAGVRILHLDVMDGQFVPNLTFGAIIVRAIAKLTECVLDTHLMVREPAHLVPAFREAGSHWISFHVEACADARGTLEAVRRSGALPGLALNPETPFDAVRPYLEGLNHLLIMSVSPGSGGQGFREEVLPKIEEARRHREEKGLSYLISVDGGISSRTAPRVRRAGAELLVAGSAIFRAADREGEIRAMLRGGGE